MKILIKVAALLLLPGAAFAALTQGESSLGVEAGVAAPGKHLASVGAMGRYRGLGGNGYIVSADLFIHFRLAVPASKAG